MCRAGSLTDHDAVDEQKLPETPIPLRVNRRCLELLSESMVLQDGLEEGWML